MKLHGGILRSLVEHCWDISEKCSDATGFVPLRSLAEYCRCQVVVRPLLVEAAITRRNDGVGNWIALLNNEIHRFSDEEFELESCFGHLGIRTRNTLAHEIAHAVAFDRFGHDFSKGGRLDERLSQIEKSVEVVSPLLLVPRPTLALMLSRIPFSREAVCRLGEICLHFAVSPPVFFNVLQLYNRYYRARFLLFDGLLEALWGVVEMKGKRKFSISSNRLLSNFFKGLQHSAQNYLASRKETEWEIVRIEESRGLVICFSRSDGYDSGNSEVGFEFSRTPERRGQFILFRLPGERQSNLNGCDFSHSNIERSSIQQNPSLTIHL